MINSLVRPLLLTTVVACSDEVSSTPDGGPAAAFEFDGHLSGTAPAGSKVAMIWVVNDGNPDYKLKFGHGEPAGTSFHLTFDTAPPADALLADGMGYGYLALVSAEIPELTRAESSSAFGILGRDFEHSVVWRDPSAQPTESWAPSFQAGFACGVCQRVDPTTGNDGLAPTDCRTLTITVGDGESCNLQ